MSAIQEMSGMPSPGFIRVPDDRPQMSHTPMGKNRRVLVIAENRDESVARIFATPIRSVRSTQFLIDSASQVAEGIACVQAAILAEKPYSVAFIDGSAGMDGAETSQKIWEIDPEIQIVLCAAYSDASWDDMPGKIGDSDQMVILKKPFDAVEAIQLAHVLTEKWSLTRQARRKMEELEAMVAERTQTLQKTNATLQMQARVIARMSEAVSVADESGKILSTNPACDRMFGFQPGELIGRSLSVLHHLSAAESSRVSNDFLATIAGGASYEGEMERRKKDGTPFVVHAQISAFEVDGETHFFAVQEDITERRKAEAELRWKTAFLEAQVASSMDGILVVDATGNQILQNQRVIDLWKIPAEFARDSGDTRRLNFVASQTRNPEHFVRRIRELYDHPDEFSHDEIELVDGRFMDRFTYPVVDGEGVYYGRVWLFRDVTERKQGELALAESKSFLQSTLDALSAHIAILNEQGEILAVNRAWRNFTGNEEEDRSVGQNYLNICDSASGDFSAEAPVSAQGIRAVVKGQLEEFELEYPCHGPTEQSWFTMRATRFSGSGAGRVVVAHENITARKKAEEALRAAHGQLEELLAHSPAVIYRLIVEGDQFVPVTASSNVTRLLDFSVPEVTEVTWWQRHVHPDDIAMALGGLSTLLKHGYNHTEYRLAHRNGNYLWISDNQRLIRGAPEDPLEIIGVWTDITERKQIEVQLLQSQKMETVGKLAGGVAHEFNSIMTAIIGQSELLHDALSSSNPLQENVSAISLSANRAATLTRQLLAFGRKQLLRPETLDLNKVLVDMESVLRHMIRQDVRLTMQPSPGLKKIRADAGQIEQVIVNIAINASEAMPSGGDLTFTTTNITVGEEQIERIPELKAGDYVLLTVTDTGVGMDEGIKARIFDPFFSTKEVGQGTGLGLATSHGIINQSGGHIVVQSELGKGSSFRIYLPQVDPQTENATVRPAPGNLPSGTETILLVEEDPALREMAGTLLRRLGYTVLTSATGKDALMLAKQPENPVIDLLLAGLTGPPGETRELGEAVTGFHPKIRLLFTTINTEMISGKMILSGAEHLPRPFTPASLAKKVRTTLDAELENSS